MTQTLTLRCRCERMRGSAGDVGPRSGNRCICYCDDCQTYAAFLAQPGVTDASGGTDIFQIPASRITIDTGADALCCVRLHEKGMYRWYAGCCRTPIGNTLGPKGPFVGLIHSFIHLDGGRAERDRVLGAPVGIQGRFARGGPPPNVHPTAPPSFLLGAGAKLALWLVTGKAAPSPFFRGSTPSVTPEVLTPEVREKLRAAPLP